MPQPQHQSEFWGTFLANRLPKPHLFAAGILFIALIALLMVAPTEQITNAYQAATLTQATLAQATRAEKTQASAVAAALINKPTENSATPLPPNQREISEQVASGDNLSILFKRMKLPQADVYALANSADFGKVFRRLRPGETLRAIVDNNNRIQQFVYERSVLESFHFTPTKKGYKGEQVLKEPRIANSSQQVSISHSLFKDGENAGLSHAQIFNIANIFAWDIDFALDIHAGDTFSVLYEEKFINDQKVGNGNILAATFTNRGQVYRAVRYEDKNGNSSFYTPDGKPMKKAFLRAPLDFSRISSNFNPNRLHPVFKTRRPHRGVDYAAAKGTPVYAAGNGKITKSGYSRANGNYVYIQHGGAYLTKYLHLNKLYVKRGQTVKQRHVIGTVGSTGYATGPHLHYEFLINGKHTNPRTVRLPQAEAIGKKDLAHFRKQTTAILAELSTLNSPQLAAVKH